MTNVPRMYDYRNIKDIIFCRPGPKNLFTTINTQIVHSKTHEVDYNDGCEAHEMTHIIEQYLELYLGDYSKSVRETKLNEPLLLEE